LLGSVSKFASFLVKLGVWILSKFYPMVGIIPLSVELLKPIAEVVSEKRIFIYDDFEQGMAPQLWEVRKPAHTPEDRVEYKPQWERSQLVMITRKRGPKIEYPTSWEGYEIVAKRPTNRVQARIALDFDGSTADNGNIHVKAKGATGRLLYLIGIDKRSKDIFFHCIDEETGYYIKSGGRIHFKDYFLDHPIRKHILLLSIMV